MSTMSNPEAYGKVEQPKGPSADILEALGSIYANQPEIEQTGNLTVNTYQESIVEILGEAKYTTKGAKHFAALLPKEIDRLHDSLIRYNQQGIDSDDETYELVDKIKDVLKYTTALVSISTTERVSDGLGLRISSIVEEMAASGESSTQYYGSWYSVADKISTLPPKNISFSQINDLIKAGFEPIPQTDFMLSDEQIREYGIVNHVDMASLYAELLKECVFKLNKSDEADVVYTMSENQIDYSRLIKVYSAGMYLQLAYISHHVLGVGLGETLLRKSITDVVELDK